MSEPLTVQGVRNLMDAKNVDGSDVEDRFKLAMLFAVIQKHSVLAACDHEWVSTHNPPVVVGGELCRKCGDIRGTPDSA